MRRFSSLSSTARNARAWMHLRLFSRQLALCIGAVVLLCVLSACNSTMRNAHSRKASAVAAYARGNLESASNDFVDFCAHTGAADRLMWELESGACAFYAANDAQALAYLSAAEEHMFAFDERARISLTETADEVIASMTNANAREFQGYQRDRVMLDILKCMTYLGLDNYDAFEAQIRRLRYTQMTMKETFEHLEAKENAQTAVLRKNKTYAAQQSEYAFDNVLKNIKNNSIIQAITTTDRLAKGAYGDFLNPFATFLSGLCAVRSGEYDVAFIEFKRLYALMPQNTLVQNYLIFLSDKLGEERPDALKNKPGWNYNPAKNCVYIVLANGLGPALEQKEIYFPLMIAWPVPIYRNAPISQMRVTGGKRTVKGERMVDMNVIFAQEYQKRLLGMWTRTIVSTLIKEGSFWTAVALTASKEETLAATLIYAIGSLYRYLYNTADTRCWELLPAAIDFAQMPMPENRTLSVQLNGGKSVELHIPRDCESALIYINAPNLNSQTYRILKMNPQY